MLYNYNKNREIQLLLSKSCPDFQFDDCVINFSDEVPEHLENLRKEERPFGRKDDTEIPQVMIDELMGAYFPDLKKIVIYLQGINHVANYRIPKCTFENLLQIVIIHEIGHYWHHSIETKNYYKRCTWEKEWIAQTFTSIVAYQSTALQECMDNLREKQNVCYKTYQEFRKANMNALIQSIQNINDPILEELKRRQTYSDFGIYDD